MMEPKIETALAARKHGANVYSKSGIEDAAVSTSKPVGRLWREGVNQDDVLFSHKDQKVPATWVHEDFRPFRQVEFEIDSILGSAPVAKTLYCLAPHEFQGLLSQLHELLKEGFFRHLKVIEEGWNTGIAEAESVVQTGLYLTFVFPTLVVTPVGFKSQVETIGIGICSYAERPGNSYVSRQRIWLGMVKDYVGEILYHPGKANVATGALSHKTSSVSLQITLLNVTIATRFLEMARQAQRSQPKSRLSIGSLTARCILGSSVEEMGEHNRGPNHQLPKTSKRFDAFWVILDRLTKTSPLLDHSGKFPVIVVGGCLLERSGSEGQSACVDHFR
ncbi:hypothetical protein OSB04_022753 [Centaurea solstitialis]|uniref:Uncharacterized protein n=1 Tax=Centaurea solstitialis TaxID=347529 RepID=A0AA38SW66_9ASTR|nr:hypothetical protein OSB04_022753 [Centaurea solstitialis]